MTLNRRDLTFLGIRSLGIAAVASCLTPRIGEAQVSTILNYAVLSHPFLALVALIELGASYSEGRNNQATLTDIADKLSVIASRQDFILQQLAQQRIVMREEIKRGFLDNDVRELLAMTQHFKIALVSDESTRKDALHSIAGRMDELATKIASYGLAAVPAYITAITLENSVHYVLGSSPSVFLTINEDHKQNLHRMLSGSEPETLPYMVSHIPKPTLPDGPISKFGRRYLLATVSKIYESDSAWIKPGSSYYLIYTYEGFRNGRPVFRRQDDPDMVGTYRSNSFGVSGDINGKKIAYSEIWYGGVYYTGDANIPGLIPNNDNTLARPVTLDSKGKAILAGDNLKTINGQLDALTEIYLKMYDPRMGPDITPDSLNQQRIKTTEGIENMRQLLQAGIITVDRLLAFARQVPISKAGASGTTEARDSQRISVKDRHSPRK
jgi:hypothetical protein